MTTESPDPDAPQRPTDDQLVDAHRQLEQIITQAQIARDELIAVAAVLRDRGIDPNTYEVGAGDSTTLPEGVPT